MRLYLSSYRLGDAGHRLASLVQGTRVAVVANALDFISDAARAKHAATVYDPLKELAGIDLQAEYFDLRRFFHGTGIGAALKGYGLVWVLGGNAFLLRRAMVASGFDRALRAMLDDDAMAYGGFSAGAVVATPTLRGIELMDSTTQLADGYPQAVIWEGLGLVDFSIVPHFRSNHPEAQLAESAARYLDERQMPFKALQDGDVWVQDGSVGALWPTGRAARASG